MRAGSMDRTILIQRSTTAVDDYGTPIDTWNDFATVRAQVVKASTDEFIRAAGASSETVVVFRVHWIDGVTVADRIIYQGVIHNLKETKELGRRQALELRTLSYGIAP
jgi:SPP1 family predicted phage head-tail adaptor